MDGHGKSADDEKVHIVFNQSPKNHGFRASAESTGVGSGLRGVVIRLSHSGTRRPPKPRRRQLEQEDRFHLLSASRRALTTERVRRRVVRARGSNFRDVLTEQAAPSAIALAGSCARQPVAFAKALRQS